MTGARDGRYELTATSVQWACVDCGATVPVEMRAVHDRWHGDQPPERCEHHRPSLAALQARYLEVRQHTLSTVGLPLDEQLIAQARYVLSETWELLDAVERLGAVDQLADAAGVDIDGRRSARAGAHAAVRHEIADVVLAATTLAGMLPGDVTVEACIAEKTEHDRGRG